MKKETFDSVHDEITKKIETKKKIKNWKKELQKKSNYIFINVL